MSKTLDQLIEEARNEVREALEGFDASDYDKSFVINGATDLDDIPEADADPDVNFIVGHLAGLLSAQRAIEAA